MVEVHDILIGIFMKQKFKPLILALTMGLGLSFSAHAERHNSTVTKLSRSNGYEQYRANMQSPNPYLRVMYNEQLGRDCGFIYGAAQLDGVNPKIDQMRQKMLTKADPRTVQTIGNLHPVNGLPGGATVVAFRPSNYVQKIPNSNWLYLKQIPALETCKANDQLKNIPQSEQEFIRNQAENVQYEW